MKVLPATNADAADMAELINAIIRRGGTTAYEEVLEPAYFVRRIAQSTGQGCWHVARDDDGSLLGFQWAAFNSDLPGGAIDIATFVRIGETGRGIGGKMFEATTAACRALGATWINASIRSDNTGGLRYYDRMGFVDWDSDPTVTLSDGTVTGKTYKRYEL